MCVERNDLRGGPVARGLAGRGLARAVRTAEFFDGAAVDAFSVGNAA
jgi:hypothetical protein